MRYFSILTILCAFLYTGCNSEVDKVQQEKRDSIETVRIADSLLNLELNLDSIDIKQDTVLK